MLDKYWHQLTNDKKACLIAGLSTVRHELLAQSKIRRARKSKKQTQPTMKFASPELERLFNSMPHEMQKSIAGG